MSWPESQKPRRDLLGRMRKRLADLADRAAHPPAVCVPSFGEWLQQTSPEHRWDWPHLVYLRQRLEALARREIRRLAIFMPPRHMKTSQSTIRFPLWCLEQDPRMRIVLGAYNQTFAEKLSREMRKIARLRPGLRLSADRKAVKAWETLQGGGVRACGAGSPPTGEGANLLVIDDPIKSRQEADSPTLRDKIWDWYSQDLLTRVEPDGAVLLIQTRWHEDDLAGRILASERTKKGPTPGEIGDPRRRAEGEWTVVCLPALAEADDPMGRAVGEALCPERYSVADLEQLRRTMGDNAFEALYQQRPTPRSGGLFKEWWFHRFVDFLPAGCTLVRYWDKAGTAGGGCYTAAVLMARDKEGRFYLVDVRRKQLDAAEREAWIVSTAHEDRERYGRVEIGIEREGGSGGKESAQGTIRRLAGFACFEDAPTGSKEARAEPLAAQFGGGNVAVVNVEGVAPAWFRAFRDEALTFPHGKYLDMVDAASGALARLTGGRRPTRILL